ncbi:MAG: rhodanese-like domain-containing protein [Thermoleophilia bacterium]
MDIQNNYWLIFMALAGGYIIFRIAATRLSGINNVDPDEAEKLISQEGAVVIDVRTHDEYAGSRIPNAKHIPLSQIGNRLKELERYRERPVVVNCRSGSRSARACKLLNKNGFSEVYNLRGGIRSWVRANHAVEN